IIEARPIRSGDKTESLVAPASASASCAPKEWFRALTAIGSPDVVVCQCEEVTRGEVVGVRAPRYLGAPEPSRSGQVSAANRESQDFVKRMTRAGMGHCQGKRCREHIAMLLADRDLRD